MPMRDWERAAYDNENTPVDMSYTDTWGALVWERCRHPGVRG